MGPVAPPKCGRATAPVGARLNPPKAGLPGPRTSSRQRKCCRHRENSNAPDGRTHPTARPLPASSAPECVGPTASATRAWLHRRFSFLRFRPRRPQFRIATESRAVQLQAHPMTAADGGIPPKGEGARESLVRATPPRRPRERADNRRVRARILVAAGLVALIGVSASAAATPRQATRQVRACLERSGATKIIRATPYLSAFAYVLPKGVSDAVGVVTIDPGGTAYFGKEHDVAARGCPGRG